MHHPIFQTIDGAPRSDANCANTPVYGECSTGQTDPFLESARLLELHPDFPRVQVAMRERIQEEERNMSAEARAVGTQARLEHVLRLLEIRAEALLQIVGDVAMQRAYRLIVEGLVRLAYQEHTGAPLDVLRPTSPAAEADLERIEAKARWWIGQGYHQLASRQPEPQEGPLQPAARAACQAKAGVPAADSSATCKQQRYPQSKLEPARWEDIAFTFTSDHRLEIRVFDESETFNYQDLGLDDRRTGAPNLAWKTLLALAQGQGDIPTELSGREWLKREKRIQALRSFMRQLFNLPDDPLPIVEGQGYRPRFHIRRGRSFNT